MLPNIYIRTDLNLLQMITTASLIERNEQNFLASKLEQETLMMDMTTGDYLGLNEVSTTIWEMLEKPHSVADIITELLKQYDVNESDCQVQTLSCLEEMNKTGMIQVIS